MATNRVPSSFGIDEADFAWINVLIGGDG